MKDKLPWYPKIPLGMPFFLKGYAHEVLARGFFRFFPNKGKCNIYRERFRRISMRLFKFDMEWYY